MLQRGLPLYNRHGNGYIHSIMVKPLPQNIYEVQKEVQEWKTKLTQQYHTNDIEWQIRIDLIAHIANYDDNRIIFGLHRLSLSSRGFNTYQHLAFLKRIALRVGNKKWYIEFENRQRVWLAQHHG